METLFFLVPKTASGCPCANPGNGGTVTLTITPGGIFCPGSGSSTWTYSGGATCQWQTVAIGGGITVDYNALTNQFDVTITGGFLAAPANFSVPATCDGTGTYPVFSASGIPAGPTCGTYTITSV